MKRSKVGSRVGGLAGVQSRKTSLRCRIGVFCDDAPVSPGNPKRWVPATSARPLGEARPPIRPGDRERRELTQTFDPKKEAKPWVGRERGRGLSRRPQPKAAQHPNVRRMLPPMDPGDRGARVGRQDGHGLPGAWEPASEPLSSTRRYRTSPHGIFPQRDAAMEETYSNRTVKCVHTVLNRRVKDAVDWGLLRQTRRPKSSRAAFSGRWSDTISPELVSVIDG